MFTHTPTFELERKNLENWNQRNLIGVKSDWQPVNIITEEY